VGKGGAVCQRTPGVENSRRKKIKLQIGDVGPKGVGKMNPENQRPVTGRGTKEPEQPSEKKNRSGGCDVVNERR